MTSASAADVVLTEQHGAVTLIRLNRPEARNALNFALANAICDAIEAAQQQRAIVLTGTDPAFCAGLDLRNLGVERLLDLPDSISAVAASAVPVICAANGPAVTGGLELALACDFIVASDRASFADTHARVGVFPGSVLLELPRRVGMARAREMSMTGNFVDAQRAFDIGLANHVVPHAQVIDVALALAAAIAEQDPELVRRMRAGWLETESLPRDAAHEVWTRYASWAHGEQILGTDIARHRDEVLGRSRTQRNTPPG
jgi:enoyl-CoA hydratase